MRTLASYAFSSSHTSESSAERLYDQATGIVRDWLDEKGSIRQSDGAFIFQKDLREAHLVYVPKTASSGTVQLWELLEPTTGGEFETIVRVGYSKEICAFSCRLRAGNPANVLSPIDIDVRTPRVVKNILKLPSSWKVENTPVMTGPQRCRGAKAGSALADQLRSPQRNLPILVISSFQGLVLHPRISELFTDDLMGLCLVYEIDQLAAWELTRMLGKEYSCFNGAIRLYWPFVNEQNTPFRHPLWTVDRLLERGNNTAQAATILRDQIKRKIFSISAFTIRMPTLFDRIYSDYDREDFEKRTRQARDSEDYKSLANEYAAENEKLKLKLQEEKKINRQLREDLHNARLIQAWSDKDEGILPNEEIPPQSVNEAVERARKHFADRLTFGEDVGVGIKGLADDAGPPQKLYSYLQQLAELVTERRKDRSIGTSLIGWLNEHGVIASGESETILKSKSEMAKRSWHDGKKKRIFNLHLKPNEATSPERCARIYFDWDDTSECMVIGWIGRHP